MPANTLPGAQRGGPVSAGPPLSASGLFVGRRAELEALSVALNRAQAGGDQLLVVAGEAGIGKTRLCQRAAAEAGRLGVPVVWGRCFEEPGAPPYWPWIQAIRGLLGDLDEDSRQALLAEDAATIAAIVPELSRLLPDSPPVTTLEGDQARFLLFYAVTQVWQRAARERGLLLVVDNLHWADAASLRLLSFLGAALGQHRLVVLGTYRETEVSRQHPLTETLAELAGSPSFQRLHLTGLGRDETELFLTSAAGAPLAHEAVARIHQRTEGHPLYLLETVRYLRSEGRLDAPSDDTDFGVLETVPAGVREIIGKRLNRLSAPCVRLLGIAACIGRVFALELLLPLISESSDEAVLGALEEAQAAHLIDPLQRPDHYQFSHALIRETLYAEMLPGRRVRLHRRIGELLESMHKDDIGSYLPQLAYHFGAALPAAPVARALDLTRRAAHQAAELLAYEEAVCFYQTALQLQHEHFPDDRERRCELLLELGTAQNSVGASEPGLATFLEAGALARELGSVEALAQAALGFETASWRLGRPGRQAVSLLTEALAAVPRHEAERLCVELLAAQCRAYAFAGNALEAMEAHRNAVALARRLGDPLALFKSLSSVAAVRYFGPSQLDERMAAAREALTLAEHNGKEEWAVAELFGWYFGDLMEQGDLPTARSIAANHVRVARVMHQPFLEAVGLSSQTLLAIHEGRFPDAETLAQETLRVGKRFSPANAAGAHGMQIFSIRREQGRLGEVLPVLRQVVAIQGATALWRPGLSALYAELDMRKEAREEMAHLAAEEFAAVPRGALWPTSMAFLAEVCAYLDDSVQAAALYRRLLPYSGRNIATGNNAPCFGAADRLLGMLAAVLRQWNSAARHFDAALEMNLRTGGRPWVVRTQFEYATLLLRRGEGATPRAVALLDAALATSRELGMAGLERGCVALQEKLRGRTVYPDGLSKREVDVLSLVSAGLGNREIGARLFISTHTVANHIRSILAKTSMSNRTEAAAYAIRNHLANNQ